jgi:hypothetical protein
MSGTHVHAGTYVRRKGIQLEVWEQSFRVRRPFVSDVVHLKVKLDQPTIDTLLEFAIRVYTEGKEKGRTDTQLLVRKALGIVPSASLGIT